VAVDGIELRAEYGSWTVDLAEMGERYLNRQLVTDPPEFRKAGEWDM
jgi:hypothetical protein